LPVSLSDIDKFERRNEGVYVNVFGYDGDKIYPLRHTKLKHPIDLLLIDDGQKQHYCLTKKFNKLMVRGSHSMYYCKRCLNGFTRKDVLYNHKTCCNEQNAVRVVLPKPDTMLSFKKYNR